MGSIFYVFVLFIRLTPRVRLPLCGSSSTYPKGSSKTYRCAVRYRLPQGFVEDLPQGFVEDLPQGFVFDLPRGIIFFHRHGRN